MPKKHTGVIKYPISSWERKGVVWALCSPHKRKSIRGAYLRELMLMSVMHLVVFDSNPPKVGFKSYETRRTVSSWLFSH